MRYIIVLIFAFLVGCNQQENASKKPTSDHVANQIDKILQQDSNSDRKVKLAEPTAVDGNNLYSQDIHEMRRVYANREGRNCITLSEWLQGKSFNDSYNNTPDLARMQQSCEGYSNKTPYSFTEIIDPAAISSFSEKSLRHSCEEREQWVGDRITRSPDCEKFFGSAKK